MRLSPRLRALTPLVACLLVAAWLLAAPEAAADASKCRSQIARVAGSFAHKRIRLIARCEDSRSCDPVAQARKLALLEAKSIKKLRLRCSNLTNADLGLGQTCPDPSGRCTQVLDSDQAIMECVLCLVRETVDPLVRRIRGRDADIAETCGGCSATLCDDVFFCETRPGHCEDSTRVGICLEIPSVCPEVFDPVCGCNGTTYGNDCLRQQARVGRFHEGVCMPRCDGTTGNSCPAGTTCTGLPGHCDVSTDAGICVPIPDDCGDHERPLCGCDGVTYANECELLRAGVRLEHAGACEEAGCAAGEAVCGEGFFCELPPEICDRDEVEGICLPRPEVCTAEYEPVCGCDGVTYSNNCDRMAAGVPLFHREECREICGGIAGVACEPGKTCELPPGECEVSDLQGHCESVPDACPLYLEPVCGCNGVTYGNDCERQMAGVQLAHFEPCFEACDVELPGSCGFGHLCLPPPGGCDPEGSICVPIPDECSEGSLDLGYPICGCDAVTYEDPCAALLEGGGVRHEGACEIL